jgi:hypothetical protein
MSQGMTGTFLDKAEIVVHGECNADGFSVWYVMNTGPAKYDVQGQPSTAFAS